MDKRRDEETAAYLREWCQARGRMEAEICRRKEHINEATNFEQARGFVRTNWKTKNWNPNDDPTQDESSSESEEDDAAYRDEQRDRVANMGNTSTQSKGFRDDNSEERENEREMGATGNNFDD